METRRQSWNHWRMEHYAILTHLRPPRRGLFLRCWSILQASCLLCASLCLRPRFAPRAITGSALLPWTSPAQAFPLGRANNSEETAVIKTPTKRRHYCNRSENSNSKNTQKFVWLILGCITSGTIFLWSIHHFVLLANDDFCDRFIIWFSDNFVNEGMREKCRHSLTASKSEKDAVTRSDRPADLHTQRTSRESSDSTADSASDSASWWSSALLDSEV